MIKCEFWTAQTWHFRCVKSRSMGFVLSAVLLCVALDTRNVRADTLVITPSGSSDLLSSVSGLVTNFAFQNTNIDNTNEVGSTTFAGGTTDYAITWGSNGSSIAGSGTMIFSGGGTTQYQAIIDFFALADTTVNLNTSFSGSPDTFITDSSGFQHLAFAGGTRFQLYGPGGPLVDVQEDIGTFGTSLFLPAGGYAIMLSSGATYGVGPYNHDFAFSITDAAAPAPAPKPASAVFVLLGATALFHRLKQRRKTT